MQNTYKVELDSLNWAEFPIIDGWVSFEADASIEWEVSPTQPETPYATLLPNETMFIQTIGGETSLSLWIKPLSLPCAVRIW